MLWEKIKSSKWIPIIFLVVTSGLVYLPRIGEFTFFKDDWYFIYDGFTVGSQVFLDVTRHTRPIRGPLYQLLFSLFGIHPLPYHLLLYMWRLLGGLGAFWLFSLLWPKQRTFNAFTALLVTIYPGFLWWTGGFEFQAYVLSFGLAIYSIVFTLKAIGSTVKGKWLLWTALAIVTGWIYLALVEFAIGMEAFRLLAIFVFVSHTDMGRNFWGQVVASVRAAAAFLVIPVSFVIWYQFFFENWRSAQKASVQFLQLISSPLNALWAAIRLFRSAVSVSVLAWSMPFYQNFFNNRMKDLGLALVFAFFVIMISFLFERFVSKKMDNTIIESNNWRTEAFWIGLLGIIAGVMPIIMANRIVELSRLSHYALPASLAGAVLVNVIVFTISSHKVRQFVLLAIIGLAVLTHHGAAANSITDAKVINEFWWQVTWRAPSIQTDNDTTLVVLYPGVNYTDGSEVAWAPANLIYYPEKQEKAPILVPLAATRLESKTLTDLFVGNATYHKEDLIVKFTSIYLNYKNILILTQPSTQACVHAIDSRWPEISIADGAYVMVGASKSNIKNIIPNGESPMPPSILFGDEPAHDWCYYYQKASLARQRGDWEEVVKIDDTAEKNGLHPNDQIELMPFVQAYAYLGNMKKVKQISTRINTEVFYKQQACQILSEMDKSGYPLHPEMQSQVDDLFCGGN